MSLESMKTRINYYGGAAQQDRMIKDKFKSLLSAVKYSYQAARFIKFHDREHKVFQGLFNSVSQNMDYDTKQISIGFDANFKQGQIFFWDNTKTYWICYQQDKTELAYFRGKCRRCDYKVKWVNKDRQVIETYVSVVGPNQPDFRTQNPGYGLSIDTASADLVVLASDEGENHTFFKQYQTFILQGITYKIHQIDRLSMPGIIQMNCVQDYTNTIEDDIEQDLKNRWNVQPVVQQYPTQSGIDGPTSIKPLFPFTFNGLRPGGRWYILEDMEAAKNIMPIEIKDGEVTQESITLAWKSPKSGAFTLCYDLGDGTVFKRQIIVESLM